MKLRTQLYLYLALVQVFPLAMAFHFFREGDLLWFFVMEVLVCASVIIGASLVRNALSPVDLIRSSKTAFEDREFGTRLRHVDIPELDEVVQLFNGLLEELHEEQLKLGEQKGFFDQLLKATPIGIVIYDFDDNISNVNPAAEQMLQLDFLQLKQGKLATQESVLAKAIVAHDLSRPALITLPDGKQFRVQQSVFYDRGFHRRFLMMEELTREMQAAERNAYETLIQMTSHEVNNTIGATNSLLQGCADYCEQLNQQDREDFTSALQVVIGRNSRLAAFMQRLAQVVRLPAPDCQPADLRPMINNVHAMFAVELKSRNIHWKVIEENAAPVNLDPHLFEQVLINVVKNAYEAIDRDGTLTITLRNDELVIQDTAGRLSQADKQKLFKPFYSTKRHGQGIGLMLVREILHLHGFSYSLDCEPGQWTRFRIVF